jgi:predicted TIM-barrel enzyme
MADVFVKHAAPAPGWTLADATRDLGERSRADAVVVSGAGTGAATDPRDLEVVRHATGLPVFVGSGADAATIASLLQIADGAIVGSSLKTGADPSNPVDLDRAIAVVAAAG